MSIRNGNFRCEKLNRFSVDHLGLPFLLEVSMEKWESVKGYKKQYHVSNLGKVKSIKRKNGMGTRRVDRILAMSYSHNMCKVTLHKNNKPRYFSVHRLVAIAFIPNPENKPCVNHKDGSRMNNAVSNLEWVTYKENDNHARRMGLTGGEKTNTARLTNAQVLKIRELYKNKRFTQKQLSEIYCVGENQIWKIIKRRNWRFL